MKLGGIYISVGAKTKKLKRDLAKAKTMTQKTAVLMQYQIDRINFAKVGIAAAAFSTIVVLGMKKAISAASDLQEVQGKFDVVFATQKKQAEDLAKVLVDSYAMSSREAKQHMASIQDLLVPMGMQADAALRMSGEVVKLSADLASFNNLPTAQVMLDIQSALVGNFETMKKYGVILNEHVLKQKALEMGLYSGKGMVDANVKAQVAFKLILEGSTFAIGDQIRTMGSYANQMKQLTANIEELSTVIGDELLPIATEVIGQINNWVKNNDNLIRQKIPFYFNEIKDSMQKIWGVITYDPAITQYGLIGLAFFGKEGWKYVAYVAAAAHLMTVTKTLAQAMGLVAAGMLDISEVATANFKELEELVERFDFPDPFFDLQLQAKQLEERIEGLRKVTEGRILTFKGDREELVNLQNELIETQSKIAAIKALKVPIRLEEALEDPSKYYGALPDITPEISTEIPITKTKEYYKQLEALAQEKMAFIMELEDEETRIFEENLNYRFELKQQYYKDIEAAAQEARDLDEEMEDQKARSARELSEYYKNLEEDKYGDMKNAMMGWANNFSSTLNEVLWEAEVTFESILESFMKMITQMMIQAAIMGPLTAGITGLFSAQGNVFSQSGLQPFARGGIVNKPTQFAFADGVGLMGEAGPEAIMPLTRTPRGDLGVKAVGEPSDRPQKQTVQIILNNPVFQDLETQRQSMVQIASIVAAQVAPGAVIENYENDLGIRQMVRGGI